MSGRALVTFGVGAVLAVLSALDIVNVALITWYVGKLSANSDEVFYSFGNFFIAFSVAYVGLRVLQDVLAVVVGSAICWWVICRRSN